MKKFTPLALAFVLTAALFTGCGCTNQNMGNTSAPTILPTTHATTEPSRATTEMTTVPTTGATHSTDETINHGNGPLEESTTGATDGTIEGRARQATPNNR